MNLSEVAQMSVGVLFVAALPFVMAWVEQTLMTGPVQDRHRD